MPRMKTTYESLRASVTDGIANVELTGPGKGNAMGPEFWRELPELYAELDANDEVRVVVLRGSGDHFSYGLDVKAMAPELGELLVDGGSSAAARTKLLALIGRMQRTMSAVANAQKPTIAAIAGRCIGGGVDLASACDIRLCAQNASFSVREVRLAIVADVGSLQRLPAIIGQGLTRELAYTGDDVDAGRALRMGLVNDVLQTPEALWGAARVLATRIAKNSPLVVRGVKRVLDAGIRRHVDEGLDYVAAWNAAFLPSEDLREALSALMERREPTFRGR
jgi:enoyl-CoA hydratase